MKTFKIEISGKTESDLQSALNETVRLIENGNLSGFAHYEDTSFTFDSEGEYEDEDNDEGADE